MLIYVYYKKYIDTYIMRGLMLIDVCLVYGGGGVKVDIFVYGGGGVRLISVCYDVMEICFIIGF